MQSVFDGVHVPPRSRQRRSIAPSATPSRSVKEESTPPTSVSPPPLNEQQGKRKRVESGNDNGRTPKIKLEDDDEAEKPIVINEGEIETKRVLRSKSKKVKIEDAVKSEDDDDVKPRIRSARRSRAPTYDDKTDEKKPKKEMLEDYLREDENFVEWPTPKGYTVDTFSPLDPSLLDSPSLRTTGPEVDSLKSRAPFNNDVFMKGTGGQTWYTADKKGRRFPTDLVTTKGELNIGATEPGKPFIFTTDMQKHARHRQKLPNSVFVKLDGEALKMEAKSNGREQGENYKAFGLYKMIWNGKLRDGQYSRLDSDTKAMVRNVFKSYLKHVDKNDFNKWVFLDCKRDGVHIKNFADDAQKDAHLDWCLKNNVQLNMYWSVMKYVGDNREEVESCERNRKFRYKKRKT